jgi:hypothetical protein
MLAIFEQLSHFEGSEGGLLAPVEPKHWLKSLVAQLEPRLIPVNLSSHYFLVVQIVVHYIQLLAEICEQN